MGGVFRCTLLAGLTLALTAWTSGCGVKAPPSGGDENLPNANAGPFRVLREGEMPPKDRIFPYAIRRKGTRNPCALDVDGRSDTTGVMLYLAASEGIAPGEPPVMILRYDADDGRSFNPRDADATVLEPSESWEGGVVDAPSVLRVGDEIWMYYAAAGGIGLATSSDGTNFTKRSGPVFGASMGGWANGAIPSDPSVVMMHDGSFRMFYEAGVGIGEARSNDGIAWQTVSEQPAIWPVPPPDFPAPEEDSVYEPFDDVSVGDPVAVLDESALGRQILRVYYAGSNRIGLWSLGMAARYVGETTLQRAYGQVLGNSFAPKGPSVLVFRDFTMLYFTAPEDDRDDTSAPAIGIGVAPATVSLTLE